VIDIEDRKQAEKEFSKLLDILPQYLCVYGADGKPLYANDSLLDFFGFTLDDFRADDFQSRAFHPDDLERVRALRTEAMRRGEGWELEARIRRKDGEYRWFFIRGKPFRDETGKIIRWFSSGTDIEDLKRTEQQLQSGRQIQAVYKQLVCSSMDGILAFDKEGRYTVWNPGLERIFGIKEIERLGQQASDLCPFFRLSGGQNCYAAALAGDGIVATDIPYVFPEAARRIFLDGRFSPLRDGAGEVIGGLAIIRDVTERKQAQSELEQLVDAVPQHLVVLDGEGQRIYANQAARDYHGLTLDQFLVEPVNDCFFPPDVENYIKLRNLGISTEQPWEVEARLRGKDGKYRWFLIRGKPLRDEQGVVIRWYLARTDIEDRKQAERELAQLVDAVPHQMVVLDPDGRRLYANQVALDFRGMTLQEFLDNNNTSRHLHPDDQKGFWEARKKGIASGAPFATEARFRPRDGQYRWFLLLYNPHRDPQGHIVRWYGTATDIDDRKQAEEALRQSQAYLAEAQALSHTGSWAHDVARTEIIYWSPEAYRIFGFDPKKPISFRDAHNRIHPEDVRRFDAYRERAIREGTGAKLDFRVILPDGSIRHVHCVSHPVFNASGEVVELVGTNMDVTEQYHARAELEKAFEEIKQLKDELYRENLALKEEIDHASMFEEIVGTSEVLRRVLVQVAKVAPADSSVLITGETGTGKELVARAIHKRSQRSSKAFITVNCAAIPPDLIGSELFGHEKGAFTGATQRRLGRFELADGGTLFLDEVGDLPAETQIALLRVLQERQFERVGGSQSIAVDVRIIAATNRDLKAAVAAESFRSDLFYRLNVFPIAMPPLRDRKDDIPLLVEYLIERYAGKVGKKIKKIHKKTLDLFQAYDWPGNIRELQNVIERAVILCEGETFAVDESWLQSELPRANRSGRGLTRLAAEEERALIESVLAETRGRIAGPEGAAAKLGIPRSTLETKIRKLGIKKHRFNPA
jgi:PAS domain S-box-containing protein